jgi:hypothetical protein
MGEVDRQTIVTTLNTVFLQTNPVFRPLIMSKKQKMIVGIILLIALWGGLSIFTHNVWVIQRGEGFDFFPRWYGARAMLAGVNPYEIDILQEVTTTNGPVYVLDYFFYPAQITYLLLPFWLLPWPVSISLWGGLLIIVAIALPLLIVNQLQWRLSPLMLGLLTFFSMFVFRHMMNVYVLGQFTSFILLCFIAAWWQISEGHPLPAALALLFAAIRPESIIITAIVLLDLLLNRRWKIVGWWGGLMGGMFLLSVFQIGFWVSQFIDGFQVYSDEKGASYATDLLPGGILPIVLVVIVIGWGVWIYTQIRSLPDKWRVVWLLSTGFVVVLLILPQTNNYTLVYLLLPLLLITWIYRFRWWSIPLLLLTLCSPWLFFVMDNFLIEQLITPLLIGTCLTVGWFTFKKKVLPAL